MAGIETISYIKIGNQNHPIDAVTVNGLSLTSNDKTRWDNKQDTLTFDSIPTENSNNLVKSGDLYTVIIDNEEITAAALNDLNDRLYDMEQVGFITYESDPVFSSSVAASISASDITNWNSKTSNTGTLTGVKFNGTNATVSNGVASISVTIPSAVTESTVSGWGFTKNVAPGTLTTSASTALSTATNEALSGNVNLHKVAKTGTYSDLVGTPNIPLAIYFDPSNQNIYFFKSTADRDSFVANKAQTSLVMFSTNTSPYIKFKDSNVLSVLLAKNIGDGVGITEAQAAAVTSMNSVFNGNTDISTFDEGGYFTGSDQWNSAFRDSSVTRVKLPIGLQVTNATGAWSYMFYGCTSLQEIDFADMVRSTAASENTQFQWFTNCSLLTTISFDSVEQICKFVPTRYILSDVPFGFNTDTHLVNLNGHELISVVIPSTITTIRPCTFYRFNRITSVTIPSSVTTIGLNAFYQCMSLKSVTIPSSVTEIGGSAFVDCALESITLPNGLLTVGQWCFSGCKSLKSLTIPATVTSLGTPFFNGCTNLTNVTNLSTATITCAANYGLSAGDGTFETYGDLVRTGGQAGLTYQKLIVHGNLDNGSSAYYLSNSPRLEVIKVGGNLIATTTRGAVSALMYTYTAGASNLKYIEVGGTITGYPIQNGAGNTVQYIGDGCIFHLKYNGIACTPLQVELDRANTRVAKVYVDSQDVLNQYLADADWANYSSKLALWSTYNGAYKNV